MRPSETMERIVNRVRYRVRESELLAHDCYWDGSNWERHGRNTFLYRTPNGRYFVVYLTMWQGERNTIKPLTPGEAYELYELLPEKETPAEEAFPGVLIEDG